MSSVRSNGVSIPAEAVVSSLDELLVRVENRTRRVGLSKGMHQPWFRGVGCVSYDLLPSALRGKAFDLNLERNLFSEFATQGARYLPPAVKSWDLLSTMQHFGAPTRALDWTTSLNTALFFAITSQKEYPALWILNPFDLNRRAFGEGVIYDSFDVPPYDYADYLKGAVECPHESPMAICVSWTNERVERQKGFFTIHGCDPAPLNKQRALKSSIERIIISTALVGDLKKYLIRNGADPFSFFPDLSGLGQTLRWRAGY